MTAAIKDLNTPRRNGGQFGDPVAAGEVIYGGTLVFLDAEGNALAAPGVKVRGVAEHGVDNTAGAAGDKTVSTCVGVFQFDTTTLTRADIGSAVYAADNATVEKTGTVIAGVLADVDAFGAWVDVG